jgi:hypothetical protein
MSQDVGNSNFGLHKFYFLIKVIPGWSPMLLLFWCTTCCGVIFYKVDVVQMGSQEDMYPFGIFNFVYIKISIMCACGATFLPADCCFSKRTLSKTVSKLVGVLQSGPYYHRVEMLLHTHTWCWFRAAQSLLFSLMMRAQQRRKVVFLFIDIGGIVNHHSLN